MVHLVFRTIVLKECVPAGQEAETERFQQFAKAFENSVYNTAGNKVKEGYWRCCHLFMRF